MFDEDVGSVGMAVRFVEEDDSLLGRMWGWLGRMWGWLERMPGLLERIAGFVGEDVILVWEYVWFIVTA